MKWQGALGAADHATVALYAAVAYFLQEYFGHSEAEADELLERYLRGEGGRRGHSYPHEQGAWGLTTEIEYCEHLGGRRGTLFSWRRDKGLVDTPREALEYLRMHYWSLRPMDG
jgi:hypothetical protein